MSAEEESQSIRKAFQERAFSILGMESPSFLYQNFDRQLGQTDTGNFESFVDLSPGSDPEKGEVFLGLSVTLYAMPEEYEHGEAKSSKEAQEKGGTELVRGEIGVRFGDVSFIEEGDQRGVAFEDLAEMTKVVFGSMRGMLFARLQGTDHEGFIFPYSDASLLLAGEFSDEAPVTFSVKESTKQE